MRALSPLFGETGRVTPPPSKVSFGSLPGWTELSPSKLEFDAKACLIRKQEAELKELRREVSAVNWLLKTQESTLDEVLREASSKTLLLKKRESELEKLKREVANPQALLCQICTERQVNLRLICGHVFL